MLFVNKVYLRYRNNEISKGEAVACLLAEIFKSPRYYCMEPLPEDEVSSFLVWIHDYIPKIIENYRSSDTTFLTYYTSSVRLRYKSWKRQNVKQKVFQDILDSQHDLDYTEQTECGAPVCESQQHYSVHSDRDIKLKEPLTTKQAVTLLVLALKSFSLLSGKVMETIPALTGISEREFFRYVRLIEGKMKDKMATYQKLENRVNASYILCRQYSLELSNLEADTCQYDIVLEKYESQKEKLRRLRERHMGFNLRPTNKMVEEVLNLPEGSVRRIIAKADKQISQIRNLLDPQKK